ncbi:hypothetical protein ACIQU3_36585 [Streptomyces sp. NPDC101110]|uniref:hypothetical protein n=1 Tax=Streptomyces sp. NPDC101110 TaxID=3366104 RepID=UPI0038080763
MTTDDRDGDVLPFPRVTLPGSYDAPSPPAPADDDDGADDDWAPVPVGSWPTLPDVSGMGPPLHLTVPGTPDPESDDEDADVGDFAPPPPEDPDNPTFRDVAAMGMAVMAAVGVACAQGMWHAAKGAKARAEHHQAIADKARLAADKATEKHRMQPGPEFGKGQKPGAGRGGGSGGSGSSGSSGGGSGGSKKIPPSLKNNGNGVTKGPQRPSPSGSGGVGPKGPAGSGKGSNGSHSGGKDRSGKDKDRPWRDRGAKDAKGPKSSDSKSSKDDKSKSAKDTSTKAAKDSKDAKAKDAPKDTARKLPKAPEPVSPWKDKPENKAKAKDAKGKPDAKDPKSEAKKADPKDGDKVDLTKKPKATEAGKDTVPPKPTTKPKPLYDKDRPVTGTAKPDGEKTWKDAPKPPVNGTSNGKPAAGPTPGAESAGTTPPGGSSGAWAPPPPPPPPPPGFEGMRPPPGAADAYSGSIWADSERLDQQEAPQEPAPPGAITRGTAALPAGTATAPAASSTSPGPAAPAVPPQRGARFVSAPVKSTQYRDAELTVYDVIDADADMAEEITEGVDAAIKASEGCDVLFTRLEALHAKVVELKVPGSLEGMVIRLMEKCGTVKARADAIAEALPRASESIATAGSNAESRHRHPADVTRDMGHTRPAEREYHLGD